MPLRILHLEDNPDDACLIQNVLHNHDFSAEVEVAPDAAAYRAALDRGGFDLIVSDTSIPGFGVEQALRAAQQSCRDTPFIVLSGVKEVGEKAIKYRAAGAAAYLSKDEMSAFVTAVRHAVHLPDPASSAAPAFSYARAMEALVQTIQSLSLARDLSTVTKIVRRAARELTGADGATFVLRKEDRCHYVDEDAIGPLWKGSNFPMSACISGWAMMNKQPAVIEDIYKDPRIPVDAYSPTFVKSLVMVPIRSDDPIGAIGTYWAKPHLAGADEVKILRALADSTSLTLENIQLYSELEERVKLRTAQYEAANKELETFSYSVSHDLRAPLRSIEGFSQMLLRSEDELSKGAKDKLDRVISATRRMSRLIEDLLSLSRVARAPVKTQILDLAHLAHEIAANLARESPQREVDWAIQAPLTICADPGLLHILMENLLSNAWKFTAKREHARIAVGYSHEVSAYFVQDNGVGFDPAYADKLFGAFQRLHDETEFPGTGIGLATVARIVHRHGGRVWGESQPNHGATFFFTMPSAESPLTPTA